MTRRMRITPEPKPARTLVFATLANSLGNGVFVTCSVLYFVHVVGFSAAQVGLGLSLAGVAGLLAGVPAGHLADRRGPRGSSALLLTLAGVATAGYLLVDSFPLFLVVAVLYSFFDRAAYAARQALVPAVLSGERLVATRARLRVATNLGMSVGAALGGLALLWGTRAAYHLMFGLDAVSYAVCGLLLLRLAAPKAVVPRRSGEARLTVLRDRPYALLALVNMVMLLYVPLLDVVLPLWIVTHTRAPRSLTAVVLLLNTLAVVFLQVRVSKRVDTLPSAVRAFRRAGVVLLAACGAFALADGRGPVLGSVLLLVAGALHVYGEMVQSAGSWVIGYELAPADQQGQYQGLFNTGIAAVQMFGPAALALLLVDWGVPGWLLLGGVFLVGGLVMRPAVRWAERSRTAFPVDGDLLLQA
jgi:MFS family permease